jgi:serine protease Do
MLTALPIVLCLLGQRPSADTPNPADIVASLETVVADAVAKAEPSVVAITRMKGDKGDATLAVRGRNQGLPAFQLDDSKLGEAVVPTQSDFVVTDFGSGVVIGDKGEILTAFHVVRGAKHLIVRAAGRQQFEAEVIAADPRSDLAVIAPRDLGTGNRPKLIPIALGDASKLHKGSFLVALGNPFNAGRDGSASASLGILSNVSRRIETSESMDPLERQLRHYPTLLQLDAKLNLGMSGGAVVNMKGELVGITTTVANVSAFDAQAGYAIPLDARGRRAVDALRQGKEVEHGLLGIRLPRDGMPTNRVGGIGTNTRAGEAGLQENDIILSIGGISVADADSMVAAVNTFPPGQSVKLKIRRVDPSLGPVTDLERTIVLSKLKVQGEVIATSPPPPWRGIRVDYLSTLPDNGPTLRPGQDPIVRYGVTISEIIPGSPADIAGLRAGLVIRTVRGKRVRSPAEFADAVADVSGPVDLATETEPKVTIP